MRRRRHRGVQVILFSFIAGILVSILVLFAYQLALVGSARRTASGADSGSAQTALAGDEDDPPVKVIASNAPIAPDSKNAAPPTADKAIKGVPVYRSGDFLTDYLSNRNYPIIVEAKPWNNSSTNVFQYQDRLGGNSFWDFWGDDEPWNSPYHMYQDDSGKWRTYQEVTIYDSKGKSNVAYLMVDRMGPGVMEKLWFTHDATATFLSLLDPFGWFKEKDPPELVEWGNLAKLGNLRIEVDDHIAYDGPIKDWFSGDAQHLSAPLKQIFVWRYQDYGSSGNIIPIAYQNHLRVMTYGGTGKPKWFTATGVTLPASTHLQTYTGSPNDLPLDAMAREAANVLEPEKYLNALENLQSYQFNVRTNMPAHIQLPGSGTIGALQVRVPKGYDLKPLSLSVKYGSDTGISVPMLAFFSEPNQLSLHHSTPIGAIEDNGNILLYSNFPMPYQNGIQIDIASDSSAQIPLSIRLARSDETINTQLRVFYQAPQRLEVYGPDYTVKISGDGKLVGLVLVTKDQELDKVPKLYLPDKNPLQEDPKGKSWPMGYLEGDLTLYDGKENFRLYAGHEDWADGGFYFNSGYTAPPGGANRPFGGILQYRGGKDGVATLFRYFSDLSAFRYKNGLQMNFGHGTYRNNFAVKYGLTAFYYSEISGGQSTPLPAFKYASPSDFSGEGVSPCSPNAQPQTRC